MYCLVAKIFGEAKAFVHVPPGTETRRCMPPPAQPKKGMLLKTKASLSSGPNTHTGQNKCLIPKKG